MNQSRLLEVVAFQAEAISVAETVIDGLGETPGYRRRLHAHLVRNIERGESYPADLMNNAYNAARCHGLPPRAPEPTPLDDYLGVMT